MAKRAKGGKNHKKIPSNKKKRKSGTSRRSEIERFNQDLTDHNKVKKEHNHRHHTRKKGTIYIEKWL
jgi:hypothetical protein